MPLLPTSSPQQFDLRGLYFNAPPPATLKSRQPGLGERLTDALHKMGVGQRTANRLGQKLSGIGSAAFDMTGIPSGYQAGKDLKRGNYLAGGLGAALSVLPIPGPAKRAGKGMFGRGIRAYHGGRAFEGDFDLKQVGSGLGYADEPAVWFTPDKYEANRYAWSVDQGGTYEGKAVYPATIDDAGFDDIPPMKYDPEEFARIIAEARKAKRPGIIFRSVKEDDRLSRPVDQIAVLDPTRIESPFQRFPQGK